MNLTPLQKLPKNWGDWGKLIVAKGFKKLPKVQNIAQSGHTVYHTLAHAHQSKGSLSPSLFCNLKLQLEHPNPPIVSCTSNIQIYVFSTDALNVHMFFIPMR